MPTAPKAKHSGSLTASDSHAVNILTLKHARKVLPSRHCMLPSLCVQHHTGRVAADVTDLLQILTRVWCLAKTFAEGDFLLDIRERIHKILEDESVGLEVVDPEEFALEPEDLDATFVKDLVDRCYTRDGVRGLGPGDGDEEKETAFQKSKAEFISFFPYGWNRKRVLHPCPAGCCGPTACHSRETSLGKAKEHVDKFAAQPLN